MAEASEMPLFEQVADVVRSLAPASLGEPFHRSHKYAIKLWFETEEAPKLHYEAQLLGRKHLDGKDGAIFEVGFHAEENKTALNDAAIEALQAKSKSWRKTLGDEPEAAPFLGRPEDWRRLSEIWLEGFDFEDEEFALEVGSRLVDYATAFEPIVRRHLSSRDGS